MKTLFLMLTMAAALRAVPMCLPSTTVDGLSLDQSCYGASLVAAPGSTWIVGLNDNPVQSPHNDWDAGDAIAAVQFDPVGAFGTFTLLAGLSAHLNSVYANGYFLFFNWQPIGTTAGIVTIPDSIVLLSGYDWATGETHLSTPGNLSWVIQRTDSGSAVPEPGSWALMGLGLASIVGWSRRWKRLNSR